MTNSSKPFSTFWLFLWGGVLAGGWLIPNHYWPWSSFQSDLWVSVFFCIACVAVLIASPQPLAWHWLSILVVMSAVIPWGQYFFDVLHFAGDAWLSSLYLLGFALAITFGDRWESLSRNQAPDGLFFAIGIGAIGSVVFQLHQWIGLDELGIWLLPIGAGRPYANFAQPNNLATFLLWGVLASAWGYHRRFFGAGVAILISVFLVFGIALTQSRTAFVGFLIIVALSCYWRRIIGSGRLIYVSILLLVVLVASYRVIPVLSELLQITVPVNRFENTTDVMRDDIRLVAYGLFLKASLIEPWRGYGWSHVGEAFFATVDLFPHVGVVFQHSHNLFLDLVLWTGWPIGVVMSGALLFWVIQAFRGVDSTEKILLFLFVALVGWHAMLELPLHYAYFLLPCGMILGVINAKNRREVTVQSRIWPAQIMMMIAITMLCIVGRDYFEMEKQFLTLRFERLRIGISRGQQSSTPLLLTQLDGFIRVSRIEPHAGMSDDELEFVRRGVLTIFNPLNTLRYIEILALNGRVAEAQSWVYKMQKSLPEGAYRDMAVSWGRDVDTYPGLASINWIP